MLGCMAVAGSVTVVLCEQLAAAPCCDTGNWESKTTLSLLGSVLGRRDAGGVPIGVFLWCLLYVDLLGHRRPQTSRRPEMTW